MVNPDSSVVDPPPSSFSDDTSDQANANARPPTQPSTQANALTYNTISSDVSYDPFVSTSDPVAPDLGLPAETIQVNSLSADFSTLDVAACRFHSTSIPVVSSTTPTATIVPIVSPTQPSQPHVNSHATEVVEVVAEGTINGTDLANVSVSEPTDPAGGTTLVDVADPVVSSNEVDHSHVVPPTSTSEATNIPAASLHNQHSMITRSKAGSDPRSLLICNVGQHCHAFGRRRVANP
ncbi:hypothetical protein V6N11_031303 [Hibiscus sabdariffa]|uniref:Uncharacterized protein n=1 Tax=Hibiscus sabdariffa TaxID=183260 RepID=A0ABR2SY23_9ROSI